MSNYTPVEKRSCCLILPHPALLKEESHPTLAAPIHRLPAAGIRTVLCSAVQLHLNHQPLDWLSADRLLCSNLTLKRQLAEEAVQEGRYQLAEEEGRRCQVEGMKTGDSPPPVGFQLERRLPHQKRNQRSLAGRQG